METKEIISALRGFYVSVISTKSIKSDFNFESFAEAADRLEAMDAQIYQHREEIADLKKQLSEQQSEWISVEDRLPNANNLVLCWWESHDGEREHYGFATFQSHGVWYVSNEGMPKVTHWMPFPEPPKPKEPTFKDVFLKAFPKANRTFFKDYCPKSIFESIKCPLPIVCNIEACWNQPYFEPKEEGGD